MKNIKALISALIVTTLVLSVSVTAFASSNTYDPHYLVQPNLELESVSPFYDGLAVVKANGKFGYMNTAGKMVIPAVYDVANVFHGGYAVVAKDIGSQKSEMSDESYRLYDIGIVNTNGNYVSLEKFNDGEYSSQSLDPKECRFNEGYVYIPYGEGTGGGATGALYSASGKLVYNWALGPCSNGLVQCGMILLQNNARFFNVSTNKEISFKYDDISGLEGFNTSSPFGAFNDGLAVVYAWKAADEISENGGYGFVDTTGHFVIQPIYEDYAGMWLNSEGRVFNDGVACVQKNGKWGGIDKKGNTVIPFTYEDYFIFNEGLARVKMGDKYGFINTTGKLVIPCTYDDADISFFEGIAWVTKNGKENYIDKNGNTVFSNDFAAVYRISGGAAFVKLDNGKYGIISSPLNGASSATNDTSKVNALPTASKVLLNGSSVSFDAYNIDGSNYFKLRDLAKVLSGTQKQFDVSWDDANKAINLISGSAYTVVGGELATGSGAAMKATANTSTILKDKVAVKLAAYNINGNNYFKLRDIGQAFNFAVTWDAATNSINIDTSKAYQP